MPAKTEPDTNLNTSNQTGANATSGPQLPDPQLPPSAKPVPCPTCKGTGHIPATP